MMKLLPSGVEFVLEARWTSGPETIRLASKSPSPPSSTLPGRRLGEFSVAGGTPE